MASVGEFRGTEVLRPARKFLDHGRTFQQKLACRLLRRGLLDNGYGELPIISDHVVATESLPPIHRDHFDRILVAEATAEGITLLTADSVLSRYPGPVRKVEKWMSKAPALLHRSPSLYCFATLVIQRRFLRDPALRSDPRESAPE